MQVRLNSAAIGHVHQERLDSVDIEAIAKEFVSRSDIRKKAFGNF
jgi:hypothetical protein